jgi:hypothetical protein
MCSVASCLFPLIRDREFHKLKAKEVVHVHALGPALLVPDLGLVLQVANDLGLAGKGPEENAKSQMRLIIILWLECAAASREHEKKLSITKSPKTQLQTERERERERGRQRERHTERKTDLDRHE